MDPEQRSGASYVAIQEQELRFTHEYNTTHCQIMTMRNQPLAQGPGEAEGIWSGVSQVSDTCHV